jgi:mannose/cellobiose epimerase-like protein (N-acyl-D-glucosamine 2-epimerase family)
MLSALTIAVQYRAEKEYIEPLEKLADFILMYVADPKDGIWLDTVTPSGQPRDPAKAHEWKANYHDVRAIVKFIEAFPKSAQVKTIRKR